MHKIRGEGVTDIVCKMHLSVLTICLKYYNIVAIISDETVYCQVQKEQIIDFRRGFVGLQQICPACSRQFVRL